MNYTWNPWLGCNKLDCKCLGCNQIASSDLTRTNDYYLPLKKTQDGSYYIKPGNTINLCTVSDFFCYDADIIRQEIWEIIKRRRDIRFIIKTKLIDRADINLPFDWHDGYNNVVISMRCWSQESFDDNIEKFLSFPLKHRQLAIEPLTEKMNITYALADKKIEGITCAGDYAKFPEDAKACDWVIDLRHQCILNEINFRFLRVGSRFLRGGRWFYYSHSDQITAANKLCINLIY